MHESWAETGSRTISIHQTRSADDGHMHLVRVLAFCTIATLLTACGHRDVRPAGPRETDHPPARMTLAEFLRKSHDTLDTTLATRAGYAVVGVRRDTDIAVLTLREDSAGIRPIGDRMTITEFGYPDVQLVPLPNGSVLRSLTYDQTVEGVVGTVIDILAADGKIRREFGDSGAECKASDFSVSGNTYTLREYRDSPFANDCMHSCAEELRDSLGFEPARVTVLERSGKGWHPIPDSSSAHRASAFARAAELVRSGKMPECSADSARVAAALTALAREP